LKKPVKKQQEDQEASYGKAKAKQIEDFFGKLTLSMR